MLPVSPAVPNLPNGQDEQAPASVVWPVATPIGSGNVLCRVTLPAENELYELLVNPPFGLVHDDITWLPPVGVLETHPPFASKVLLISRAAAQMELSVVTTTELWVHSLQPQTVLASVPVHAV